MGPGVVAGYSPPMTLPAVPLVATWGNGQIRGGTGFFLDVEGTIYLVTAAHLPRGERADDDWANWRSELTIALQHRPRLSLFTTDLLGRRTPRFFFGRSSTDPCRLVDVIAFPASPYDLDLQGVQVHSIRSVTPEVGEVVTLHGYPAEQAAWPTLRRLTGPVTGTVQAFLAFRVGVMGGFSGGPLVGSDGRFLGMVVGSGRPDFGPGDVSLGVRDDDDLAIVPGMISCLITLVDGHFPPALNIPFYLGRS